MNVPIFWPLNQWQAVTVQWPERISEGESADVEDWMQLVIRKMKRSAQKNEAKETA